METQKDEEPHVCVACLGVLQEFCDVTQATKVCVDVVKHIPPDDGAEGFSPPVDR